MEPFTWTFIRGDAAEEQLTMVRVGGADDEPDGGVHLVVTTNGTSRSFDFTDARAARRFQSDMEAMLLRTGWTFVGFAPERRTGRDRRGFPRLNERRRWWTDGTVSLRRFFGWSSADADDITTRR